MVRVESHIVTLFGDDIIHCVRDVTFSYMFSVLAITVDLITPVDRTWDSVDCYLKLKFTL